jgi:hypothetical protein
LRGVPVRGKMSFSSINALEATYQKLEARTQSLPSVVYAPPVLMAECCIGMCEVGISAYRRGEIVYPELFGTITTAAEKRRCFLDLSHFTILGSCVGIQGIKPDLGEAIFKVPNIGREL